MDDDRPKHLSNTDFDFFYAGLEAGKLLIQRCQECGTLRNPPGPMCPRCRSLSWTTVEAKGAGTLFSYTIHHHPPLPGFDMPHPIGLVALDEGVRFIGALSGIPLDEIRIGMPLEIAFVTRNGLPTYEFRPTGAA